MANKLNKRRYFLQKTGATALALISAEVVFSKNLINGIEILDEREFEINAENKHPEMVLLSEKPINMEALPHLLDDNITPEEKLFIRNNGNLPDKIDASTWQLEISGESAIKKSVFSLNDLKTKFKQYTYQLVLECAGNGRSGFSPQAAGNQWKEGAVSCAKWTGVRLKDVLNAVGIKSDAVYIGYFGADIHLSGDVKKAPISRGIPIKKAMENEVLLAWQMNGKDIPLMHGYPLRLVVGGYPASVSGKWLRKLVVRNKIHDGEKMEGSQYRMPKYPVEPGTKVPDDQMKIIESMPVKSLITYPRSGAMITDGSTLEIRGKAWAGDFSVKKMAVSIDFGASWKPCELKLPANRLAWQNFSAKIKFPQKGYYEVWAKATDEKDIEQPMVIPSWNPGGYLNNSCHRIAVKVY
jgi:DMSO/TMAO reductase YedYZ molybdopterin-dependent catalytic subunit